MRARFASLSPRARMGMALAAILLYGLAVWFLLVSPKRAEATALADDVAAAELRLVDAQVAATRPSQVVGTSVSDVLHLAKAMPPSAEQSGLVLELELLGRSTGLRIDSIAPGDPLVTPGKPTSIPVIVTAEGSYRQFLRFLTRARALVDTREGTVRATGRLFTVQSIDLSESKAAGFPRLAGIVKLNAFVYDGPLVPETPEPPTASEDDVSSTATAAGATP